MVDIHIESFVSKVKTLCSMGYKASWTFDSNLGELYVKLNCSFGRNVPTPSSPIDNVKPKKFKQTVSPSRKRVKPDEQKLLDKQL